jgi:ribosomal protein S6--L-glutamate ligase
MKEIKFAIFGSLKKGTNTRDLYEEIRSRGHECSLLNLRDVVIGFSSGGFSLRCEKDNLLKADIFLFRSITGCVPEAKMLMERLVAEGKVIVDEGVSRRIVEGKMFQFSKLERCGIEVPRTVQTNRSAVWKALVAEMKFPIVVKPVKGSRGQGVQKMATRKAALEFFRDNPRGYLAQEFFELDGDFRLFVVKGKVLGGIKRHIIPGDFRTNCSLGSRAEKVRVTKEMRTLAQRAAKAVDYEVAGVDIIEHKGRLYVLEVNPSPQWEGFKRVTGINPAGAIIDLALAKYQRKKSR